MKIKALLLSLALSVTFTPLAMATDISGTVTILAISGTEVFAMTENGSCYAEVSDLLNSRVSGLLESIDGNSVTDLMQSYKTGTPIGIECHKALGANNVIVTY